MMIFKFKTDQEFKKAENILKKAIDTMGTSHFDHSYQPDEKTITVSEKNAHIVEGWLNKNKIKFTLDRGYGKYAMADYLRSIIASSSIKPVIRKTRISEQSYDICPHCGKEIGEKAVFYDEKGKYGSPGLWYHRGCTQPIEFPEPDYTKYSQEFLSFLSPKQLKIREKQLKDKKPEGYIFYFRVKILGNTRPEYMMCHPECEYLEGKKCNLFKKALKESESGIERASECVSAVEGKI